MGDNQDINLVITSRTGLRRAEERIEALLQRMQTVASGQDTYDRPEDVLYELIQLLYEPLDEGAQRLCDQIINLNQDILHAKND